MLSVPRYLLNTGLFGVILILPRFGKLGGLSVIVGVGLDMPMVISPVVLCLGSGVKPKPTLPVPFGSRLKSKKPMSPVTFFEGGLPYNNLIVWKALPGPFAIVAFCGFLPNIVTKSDLLL